tara:strand:+ start:2347 stop:4554 length:2208 start_codon:yes stop_codon:yes gene_type:complete
MPLTETSKPEEKAIEPPFHVPPKLIPKPGQERRIDKIIREFSVHYQEKNVLVEKANLTLLKARDALLKSINTPPEEINKFRHQYNSPAKSLSSPDLSFVNISRSAGGIALDVRHFQIASFRLALAREIDPYEDELLYNFLLSLTEGEGLKEEKPFEEKIKENLCKLLNLSTNDYDRLIKYDQEDTEFQETYRYFYTEIFEKLNLKLQKIFSSHEIIVPLIKIITNTLCKNNDIINIYEKNSLPSFVVTCVNLTITLLGELCNDISIATDSPKSTQVSKYDDDLKEERLPIPKIDHKKKEKDVWIEIFQLILVADIQPFDLENDFLNKLHESININKVEHDFIAQKITELILEKLKEHNIISYNNIKPVSSENPVHTSDTIRLDDELQHKSDEEPVTNEGSDDCQSDEEGYWDTDLRRDKKTDALKTPTTSFSVRRNSDDAKTITEIEKIVGQLEAVFCKFDQLEAVFCKLNKSNVSQLSSIETAASIAENSKEKESESISNSLSILSTRTKIFIQQLKEEITDIENSLIDLKEIEMEPHEKSNRKADKKVQTEKKVEENVELSPPKPKTPREERTYLVIKLLALEERLKEATNISIILQSININNKELSNRLAIEIREINDDLGYELVELNKELENELNELKTKFNLLQKKNDRLGKDAKKVHEEDKTKLEHGSKVQEPGSKKDDKQKFPILKEQKNKQPNKQPKNKKDYSKRSTTPIVGSPMVSEMISKCCSIS